ncbi:class I glutamine amidotransferase-like protein [Acephala macrosclerotiorum]|nr:class I glutamine amidotransferase-like protein [Acephala macrosclerotiorum]
MCSISKRSPVPTRYGVVLFPAFEAIDIFGPLDALNALAYFYQINLTLISTTLDPSSFGESIVPAHAFDAAPELDVLIVPEGLGTRALSPQLDRLIAFVKERFPTLKYLITVCTGAALAAHAGVLDGKYATTNKKAWVQTTALGPKDGNVFTSSGVSAGIDVTIAFIEAVYGNATATSIANGMEYVRHLNSTDDPFAALYGLTDANNSTNQS